MTNIKKVLPGVKENILLKNYTTFRIGGPAKYFFVAKTKEDLIKAILAAKKLKLPFFILGGGSNLLVSDKGFKGLIIRIMNQELRIKNQTIYAEAGKSLALVVSKATENSLSGLEWAAGIPGTVGGAIRGNAGAFKKSMADIVKTVEVFDATESRIMNHELSDCKFGYRDSVFKKNKNLIILSVKIQLKKGNKKKIKEKLKECLDYRKRTQPLGFPSAGSVFKNYESRITNHELLKKFPEFQKFNKKGEIPAAWLIENCGLKGKKIGKAKISEKHANFIVNLGEAEAKNIVELIKLIKKEIKNRFNVELEEEIEYLGF